MNIIGIAGDNNSGKTTLANVVKYLLYKKNNFLFNHLTFEEYLKISNTELHSRWDIKSFSTKVAKAYKLITGIDFYSLSREEKERERLYFIDFAQSMKKPLGDKVWINALFKDANPIEDDINWIIDDLRFTVEYDYLRVLPDSKLIKIGRNCPICDALFIHKISCSISNSEIFNKEYDYFIENNGTIDDLIIQANLMLKEWKLL